MNMLTNIIIFYCALTFATEAKEPSFLPASEHRVQSEVLYAVDIVRKQLRQIPFNPESTDDQNVKALVTYHLDMAERNLKAGWYEHSIRSVKIAKSLLNAYYKSA